MRRRHYSGVLSLGRNLLVLFLQCDEWESNGQVITRDEAIIRAPGKKGLRKRVGIPANIRPLLVHIFNCILIAVFRDRPKTTRADLIMRKKQIVFNVA